MRQAIRQAGQQVATFEEKLGSFSLSPHFSRLAASPQLRRPEASATAAYKRACRLFLIDVM